MAINMNIAPINKSFEADMRSAATSFVGGQRKALSGLLGFCIRAVMHGDFTGLNACIDGTYKLPPSQVRIIQSHVARLLPFAEVHNSKYRVKKDADGAKMDREWGEDAAIFFQVYADNGGIENPALKPAKKDPTDIDVEKAVDNLITKLSKAGLGKAEIAAAFEARLNKLITSEAQDGGHVNSISQDVPGLRAAG